MIKFTQNYSTYRFNQKLKAKMFTTATILRNGKETSVKVEDVVKGDIIHLNDFKSNIDEVIEIWNHLIEHRTLLCDNLGNLQIECGDEKYPAYKSR